MARKRRETAAPRSTPPKARGWQKPTPDWIVLVPALLGMLLTAYLTIAALNESAPAFCTDGSGCDLVQQSQWSRLFGIPVAFFGFGLYLLLAFGALFATARQPGWRRQWTLALVGVAVSVYLTAVAAIALQTFCGWCLLSFALILGIFVVLTLRRPAAGPGVTWKQWLANCAVLLVALLGTMYVAQSGLLMPPEDPRLKALAEHLDARGAKFYGASWCPTCQNQKELFGRSAERLPYVECSPQGRNGPVEFACVSADVSAYPTWIIRGRRYTEIMQPEELARRTAFDWNGYSASADD